MVVCVEKTDVGLVASIIYRKVFQLTFKATIIDNFGIFILS